LNTHTGGSDDERSVTSSRTSIALHLLAWSLFDYLSCPFPDNSSPHLIQSACITFTMSAEEVANSFARHYYNNYANVENLRPLFVSFAIGPCNVCIFSLRWHEAMFLTHLNVSFLLMIFSLLQTPQSTMTFEGTMLSGVDAIIEKLRGIGQVTHSVKTVGE
jgi:hypothetical protein